jgi:apolipoprotein N-acyltransferase
VGDLLPALLSALLLILAHPPFRILLLPFVALAPLVTALGAVARGPGSGRAAARMGLSFGVLHWGILLIWVPLVVGPRFPWAYPGYVAQVGLLGGLAALMAWGTHRLHRGACVPLPLAFPLAWVGMEWLKAHFPLGLSFPWLGLGISLTSWPELVGMAEWTGEGGVAFWLAMVNGLLASSVLGAIERRGDLKWPARPGPMALLAVGVGLLPAVLGSVRAGTLRLSPGPGVVVVGTNVPRTLRLRPAESSAEALDQAQKILGAVQPGSADLVILPEATVLVPLDGMEGAPYLEALGGMARAAGSPILLGALGTSPSPPLVPPALRGDVTNSAFLVRLDGSLGAHYDKVRLVPGMEWGGVLPGRPGVGISANGWTFGPLICYESLFGDLARAQRLAGAEVLVNLSSDVWFGEGTSGISALFLYQHAAHLVMRAVENRSGVARAANGGFSMFLDPLGNPVDGIVPPEGGLALAAIPVAGGVTLFTRTGDLVGPAAALVSLLILGWVTLLPQRAPNPGRRRAEKEKGAG